MPEGFEPDRAGRAPAHRIAEANAGSYPVQLALAAALEESEPDAALAAYQRAAALVPLATGDDSPQARIAALLHAKGDKAGAAEAPSRP